MQGIEHLKLALKFVANFSVQVAGTKKFSFLSIFSFIDDLIALGAVITSWKDIVAEFKDLTDPEREELYAYAQANLNIPHEQTKAFVADSFDWALKTFSLVERARTLAK